MRIIIILNEDERMDECCYKCCIVEKRSVWHAYQAPIQPCELQCCCGYLSVSLAANITGREYRVCFRFLMCSIFVAGLSKMYCCKARDTMSVLTYSKTKILPTYYANEAGRSLALVISTGNCGHDIAILSAHQAVVKHVYFLNTVNNSLNYREK